MMTSEAKPPKVRDWTWLKVVASILLGVAAFGIIITILAIVAFPNLFVLEVARVALLGICILMIVALGVGFLATVVADVNRVTLPKEKRATTTRWIGSNWWWAVWLVAWLAVTYMAFFLETDPAWELIQASFLLVGMATVISAVDSMERFLHRDFTPWVLAIVLAGLIFVTIVGLLALIEADFVQAVVLLLLVLLVIRVTTLPVTIARRYGKDDEIVFAETPDIRDSEIARLHAEIVRLQEELDTAHKSARWLLASRDRKIEDLKGELEEMYSDLDAASSLLATQPVITDDEGISKELAKRQTIIHQLIRYMRERGLLQKGERLPSEVLIPQRRGPTITGRRDARVEETPAPNVQVVPPPEVRVNTADEGDVKIDVSALEQALNNEEGGE